MNRPAARIEVAAEPGRPLGMTAARFLRVYWQKRPLLVRRAFPQFHNWISSDDLAGLACEDASLARLVLHEPRGDRWTVRNGPFVERDFARLPKKRWTLLVQDVDKWDADVAALLDRFDFLPAWRIDDVMVSYAVDGGGVGAHVDNYDVFLVQGSGRRRWRIDASAHDGRRASRGAGAMPATHAFRSDTELKLLQAFAPTHDWLLEPGDLLYLPPQVPHEGTAVGECLTCSVGMRAPSVAELMLDFAESVTEPIEETHRYADPDLQPARERHEIDRAALRRARSALARLRANDDAELGAWFGRFVTRYRSAHDAAPLARPLAAAQFAAKLPQSMLVRNPWSRVAWTARKGGARLFVAGDSHDCSRALARLLCAMREIDGAAALRIAATGAQLQVLLDLVNAGHLALVARR